ncbi:MAG: glutaminase, partial [Bacteroidales bacterium]|nr:glutaminase [Bacteroidales bacterium]
YKEVTERIYHSLLNYTGEGSVADYIPALSKVNPKSYSISVCDLDGGVFSVGDYETRFTIQSISKVFSLAMVSRHLGDKLWEHVGREPSGTAFNSLIQLEQERGIPRNPFINAGALVVTDKIIDLYDKPKTAILDFVRGNCGENDIYYNKEVAKSEMEHSHRNIALANFMKSFGNIKNDIDTIIDIYCNQCSISMNTQELAKSFLFLANGGINPLTGERVIGPREAKRLNALLLTCGLYNESGDFAYRVGLPGKSGVGGGVVAIIPGRLAIAVWSPELNKNGNSYRGIATLEQFTTDIGISVF